MYTAHAKVRMQQRAIPSSIVNFLLDYGERNPPAMSRYKCSERMVLYKNM